METSGKDATNKHSLSIMLVNPLTGKGLVFQGSNIFTLSPCRHAHTGLIPLIKKEKFLSRGQNGL
jgi:hypothetical protein